MSRWFRFYDDAINDPKILKLSDKLHRIWIGILCIASKNDGALPSLDDMALMVRMKPEKLGEAIKSLMIAGLIDEDEAVLSPHNWNGRQFKSDVSTERVKRFRKQQRNVSETPPETETETETEQKQINCADAKAPRTKAEYSTEFETQFWAPYPRSPTMSKKEAWREWMKLAPDERTAACQAIDPYRKHLRSKPTLETVHACRFLSQRRFDGFSDAPPAATAFDIRSSLV